MAHIISEKRQTHFAAVTYMPFWDWDVSLIPLWVAAAVLRDMFSLHMTNTQTELNRS